MSADVGGSLEGASSAVSAPAPRAGATEEERSIEQRVLHLRANRAFALAKQARAVGGASSGSDGPALAVQLFRQSIYWSLSMRAARCAGSPLDASDASSPAPGAVFAQSEDQLRARLGARSDEAFEALMSSEFTTLPEQPPERLHAIVPELERLASELLFEDQRWLLARQRRQTWAVAAAFLALGVVLVGLTGAALGMLSQPDLAKGKPWTTSSVYPHCDFVAKRCGGVSTEVFFCTDEQENPWFEYDLGAPLQFTSLTIFNRSDSVQERAVPLIVEISNDKKTYQQIASRKEVFDVWRPSFPPKRARYVRLRVARRSFLHLDRVAVHP